MERLLLATQTKAHLAAFAAMPPHALLFVGPAGLGKLTVATKLAQQITTPAQITLIEPDEKATISIETVRRLYQHTRAKQQDHQVIIIDHAEAMGIEAQNALLKLLEEPRAGVTFILTSPSSDALLPTITSRLQTVILPRLGDKQLQGLATQLRADIQPQALAQLLFVADGRPATLVSLLRGEDTFNHHKQIMQQAKFMLAATPYERLCQVTGLAKNKTDAVTLLEAMARMLQTQLMRDPTDQLLHLADGIQLCLARLAQNGNPRAQLTALFAGH